MRARLCLTVLAVLSFITYSLDIVAQEQTPTGFYYPTGTSNFNDDNGWLAIGCNGSVDYLQDEYHLGKDISSNVGDNVYAISGGVVVNKSLNGWGAGNIALVVKHTLTNGIEFLAVYGHIASFLDVGSLVEAGKSFATIGSYSLGPHLHFGIHLGTTIPSTNWGKLPCASWPNTNGFVEPISWIKTQKPPLIFDHLDAQAKQDMVNRASSDLRFGNPISETFGKNLEWSPDWELRWMSFNFTSNRSVLIYHITSKHNSSVRYTIFWDPDSNSRNGWNSVP